MRSLPPHRFAATVALGFALWPGTARGFLSQEEPSAVAVLLSRARTLEQRGRLDLAEQDWAQVLLADPNDAEALAGLARAAKAEGRASDASEYLSRLRAAHPSSPELARMEGGVQGRDTTAELKDAARLARAGDSHGAMTIYRRLYGLNPPAGLPALAYYETEGSTEDDRPAAIAGLRALGDRFPADARYKVALGRLLLVSPRTRAEGRTLLEELPDNPRAAAALREGTGATGQGDMGKAAMELASAQSSAPVLHKGNAATVANAQVRAEMAHVQTQATLPVAQAGVGASRTLMHNASAPSGGPMRHSGYSAEEQAAYAALDGHRAAEAEQRFRDILAKDPMDARALAGMGYVRAGSGDLKGAVGFFERAQENGDRSLALTRALVNAEFEFTVQHAGMARAKGELPAAETEYRAALRERPSDPGALEGFADTLLQAGRAEDAIPVYAKLTQLRPMSPAAWRGLVLSQAAAGHTQAVVATAARVPQDANLPLQSDTAYELTVAAASRAQGTQVARVETPSRPVPAPKPATARAPEAALPARPQVPPRPSPSLPGEVAVGPPPKVKTPAKPASPAVGGQPKPEPPPPAAPVASPAGGALLAADVVVAGERVKQAEAALQHGNNGEAAALLRDALSKDPGRTEAWRGLVLALHNEWHDVEAVGVLARISAAAQPVLERDATFEATAGEVYLHADRPEEALRALARAQDVFATQRLAPPLELVMEIARLLAARGDDDNLYRELMYLGERQDLTSTQRQQVQMVWTDWAVRRARVLAAAGDRRRAVVLLNAAAQAFSGNARVVMAIAEGYSGIGLPREAVALYKAQDLSKLPVQDVEAAVSAATAAHDFKAAGSWARLGLQRFGNDPEMLTVAAELEQARGHEGRALSLTEQAKAVAPAQDPGQVLTAELKEAKAGQGWEKQGQAAGQLSILLAPADAMSLADGTQAGRPYLPEGSDPLRAGTPAHGADATPVLSRYEEPSR